MMDAAVVLVSRSFIGSLPRCLLSCMEVWQWCRDSGEKGEESGSEKNGEG
jgi:hypothetical protein